METIGRVDKADFPELQLKNIKIKVDTGAYTSSLHSHEMRTVASDEGRYLEFKILDPLHKKYRDKVFRTKNFEQREFKSSFGDVEIRYVITTVIVIFGQEYPIEMSLSERGEMKSPILLGRKFLTGKFLVDPSLKDLSFKLKQPNAGNSSSNQPS